jgi:glyoxylase-like metal-dependent hydrolase (beta-lactamase superfamily II)
VNIYENVAPIEYEVYAIKYAERLSSNHATYIHRDPHDGPAPMDYFVWAIIGGGKTYVVDLGFDRRYKRGARHLLRSPAEGLKLLDIDAARVEEVIVTHMHYDHAGSVPDFPKAQLWLQEDEMAVSTGHYVKHKAFRFGNFVEYTVDFVRALYDDRVAFLDGDKTIAPGIELRRVGGHTHGMQLARVWTRNGWLVLASDAVHMYDNMLKENPYPAVFDMREMLDSFRDIQTMVDAPNRIIPGHDPLVLQSFPAPSAKLDGIVARLD